MELKIFRDALPAAGTNCTLKAELPLETEILISDYLPPVFKLVKCFVRPVVLQKRLQPRQAAIGGISALCGLLSGEEGRACARPSRSSPLPSCWTCRSSSFQRGPCRWKARPNI